MPPAARITDPTTHGAPLAPGPGSANVLIGGLPTWRADIDQHACPAVSVTGADGVGSVVIGSPTVLINNMMACRMGDIVVEKPGLAMGPANPIIMGEPTVEIGEVGMGSPVVVTPIPPMVILARAMAPTASGEDESDAGHSAETAPQSASRAAQSVSNAAQALAQSSQDGAPFVEPYPACEALKNAMGTVA